MSDTLYLVACHAALRAGFEDVCNKQDRQLSILQRTLAITVSRMKGCGMFWELNILPVLEQKCTLASWKPFQAITGVL